MDTDVGGGTVGLLALDALDVDPELGTVALDNLADLQRIHSENFFLKPRLGKYQCSFLNPRGIYFSYKQCFGSGSGRIRIIGQGPDPYQETLI